MAAGELRMGEHLQRADGTLTQVTQITPHRGPPVEVFNLEIDTEHVYHVGDGGVLVHNAYHHSIAKYLGGFANQRTTNISSVAHTELHSILRMSWRALGFPPEGGITGSYRAWREFLARNPGAQRRAFDEVLDASRQNDYKYGTNIVSDLWGNLLNGNFTQFP
ncbi:MAG: hypothetical protein R3C01_16875 [Planctomycetaceae bacterium]